MTSKDKQAVQRIVALDGDCLKAELCVECPFKSKCLPEFLTKTPPTKNQRLNAAMDILAHATLFES